MSETEDCRNDREDIDVVLNEGENLTSNEDDDSRRCFTLEVRCSNQLELVQQQSADNSSISEVKEQSSDTTTEQKQPFIDICQVVDKSRRMESILIVFLNNYREFSKSQQIDWPEFNEIQKLLDRTMCKMTDATQLDDITLKRQHLKTLITGNYPMIRLYTNEFYHSALFYALKVSELSVVKYLNRMNVSYPLLRIMDIELDHLCDQYMSKRRFAGTLYRGEYWESNKLNRYRKLASSLPVLMRDYETLTCLTSTTTDECVALRFMKRATAYRTDLHKCFITVQVFTVEQDLIDKFRATFPEFRVLEDVVVDISEFSIYTDEKEYLIRENSINKVCGCKKFIYCEPRKEETSSFNVHICLVNARLLDFLQGSNDSKICSNLFSRIINYTLLNGITRSVGDHVVGAISEQWSATAQRYYTEIQSYFNKVENYRSYLESINHQPSDEILSLSRERIYNNMILVRYFALERILDNNQQSARLIMIDRLTKVRDNLNTLILVSLTREVVEMAAEKAIDKLIDLLTNHHNDGIGLFKDVLIEMMQDLEILNEDDRTAVSVDAESILERVRNKTNTIIQQTKLLTTDNLRESSLFCQALKDLYDTFKVGLSSESTPAIDSYKKKVECRIEGKNELSSTTETVASNSEQKISEAAAKKEKKLEKITSKQSLSEAAAEKEKKLDEEFDRIQNLLKEDDNASISFELMDQLIDPILLSNNDTFRRHLQDCLTWVFGSSHRLHEHCNTVTSRLIFSLFVFCIVNCQLPIHWGAMNWTVL